MIRVGLAVLAGAMVFGCGGEPAPTPVPEAHTSAVGQWLCAGGDTHDIRADGTYLRRHRNFYEPVRRVLRYEPGIWTVDNGPGAPTTLTIAPADGQNGQICASIAGRSCAKVQAPVPEAAVGRWKGKGVVVEVRTDGFTRVVDPHTSIHEGQLLLGGGSPTLQLCGAPLPVAIGFGADGGVTLAGETLELVDREFDEKAVAAMTARRAAEAGH